MDSSERAGFAEDKLASVIDRVTRTHERIVEGLTDLLARVAGVGAARPVPVPVRAAAQARYSSR